MEEMDLFIMYSQYHDCWWPCSLCRQVNIMTADDLAPYVARASAAIILTLFSHNIPVSSPQELNIHQLNFKWFTGFTFHIIITD